MPVFVPSKASAGPGGHFVRSHVTQAGGGHFVPAGGRARKKKRGRHGPFGVVENLASDIGSAVVGLPTGIVHTVEHPVRAAREIGRQYAKTYGPLTHGDVSQFLHNLYEHPLGPILDVATIFTAGAGAAARAGGALSRAGVVAETSRLGRLGEAGRLELRSPRAIEEGAGKTLARPLSRNPAIRLRQQAVDRMLKKLPAHTPYVGEIARYGRELDKLPRREAMRLKLLQRDYNKAVHKLKPVELAALHLIGRGVSPEDWLAFLHRQGDVGEHTLKVLENPELRELWRHPNEATRRAHAESVKLSRLDAELKIKHDLLTPETAEQRLGLHRRTVQDSLRESAGPLAERSDQALLRRLSELNQRYDRLVDGLARQYESKSAAGITARRNVRRSRGHAEPTVKQGARDLAETQLLRMLETHPHEPQVQAFRAEVEEAQAIQRELGRREETHAGGEAPPEPPPPPIEKPPLEPFYIPDRAAVKRVANADFARLGGGVGVQRSIVHQNRGVLFRTGQLALDADLLGPEYLRTVKYALFDDIHNELLASAVRVPKGQPLPEGWVYVRRKIRQGAPVERGRGQPERIGHLEQVSGEHARGLEELIPKAERADESVLAEQGFTTANPAEAESHFDYRLVVPKRLADRVAGEFSRSHKALRLFFERPTQVWRALVLGARVGFLVNNVVGNHLLYALKFAGPAGLRAYLNALRNTKGLAAVRKLLAMKETPRGISREFMAEFFPEQIEGTFVGTQVPRGRLGRVSRAASLGLQVQDRAIEQVLRRAGVEAALRRNPRVKHFLRQMPRQTRSLEDAARRALDEPAVQREISDEVNAALGDYNSLSALERGAVRAVFPFYAWYRAITVITAKLALDAPGRANLLAKVGQLGRDLTSQQLGPLPSYLQGAIPLGADQDGKARVLTTTGLNPFATVQQVGKAASAGAIGPPGSAGRELFTQANPFIQALIEQGTGRALFTGGEIKGGLPGLPLSILQRTGENLPFAQLRRGPSSLYPERDLRAQLLAYLGVPVKELSLAEAHRRAREEGQRAAR